MAGKIEVTASVLIALASLTAGQALAATDTSGVASGTDNIGTKTKSMASGTMLDGYAVLKPVGLSEVQIAQAPPAEGQPDPNLLLKPKHPAEAEKPEPQHERPAQPPAQAAPKPPVEAPKPPPEAPRPPVEAPKPHVEAPRPPVEAPRPPAEAKEPPAAKPAPQPVPHAPEPVKPPPQPKVEPAPEAQRPSEPQKPKLREPAPEAPKPQQEKPAQPTAPKEPPVAKPAPDQVPEPVKPAPQKRSEPTPPKAEQAPAPVAPPAEKPVPVVPKPPAGAPQQEAPALKPEGKPPASAAEKPADAAVPAQPTPAAPPAAGRPAEPGKVVTPPPAVPAAEAPVKERPPKPNQPDAPVPQGTQAPVAPAPAPSTGTPPPVPPAPAPGDGAKAPTAILPPLNTVQSRDPAQPAQGGQPGQPGQAGKPPRPGQPGQAGQPGAPSQVPEAARPQFSQEQQQPFTPKELQRLKALAARPDQSNDTIVLPVDNGAPVLDSDKDANWRRGMSEDQLRRMRKQSAQDWNYAVPQSDEQAQRDYFGNRQRPPVVMESIDQYQGRRLQRAPQFLYPEDVRVGQQFDGDRRVMDYDGQIVVRGDDNRRFEQFGRPVVYEQVDHQRVRETVFKQNGDRIVSLRNRYGQLIQRSRVDADGEEVVLFYSPDLYAADDSRPVVYRDPGSSLPPMRLRVPLNDYIVDVGSQPDRNYYDFIEQPPVEPVERVYTIDEVRNSARIRDKMRRIDLDTITFATGSWDISMNQAGTLKKVADAISKVLKNNPAETFLIEGHTDAVGSAESNLVLSDRRAEAVANVLTQVYGIAPENMVTQGYGEQFLKVMTYGPEQQNRRVTIRRVTPLVRPVQ